MSIESDSRACLIESINDDTGTVLRPDQLNDLMPSSEGFNYNSEGWNRRLAASTLCLKQKGYELIHEPTRPEAGDLLDKPFSDSVIRLTECVAGPLRLRGTAEAAALVATGAVLGVAATVAVQAVVAQSASEPKSGPRKPGSKT